MIPEFSGKAADYKEFRKRLLLYEKKMELAGRKSETAFNILSSLKGRAWDACEDLGMDVLESDRGMREILSRLDSVFKFDAITELPQDFENFFISMQRKRSETMQEYTANFERQLRRLAAHDVALPEKVIGWYYLRRAGLSQSQRQLIMSTIQTTTLSLDTVRKAVNFVIGQDQTPDGGHGRDHKFNKNKDNSIYTVTEDAFFEPEPDEAYYEEEESWEIGPEDSLSQAPWGDEDSAYFEAEEDPILACDAASEYDDIMANYVEARSKMNQMRVSRGYYPVVAMVQPERTYNGSGSGKGKSKKGKGKAKGKQQPKPPSAKARGRAALGAIKCLRCGQAGHMAARCPAQSQNKRKADNDPELEIHMIDDETADDVNIFDDDDDSKPDDTAMFDSGAASVVIGRKQLKRLMRSLRQKGCDLSAIPAWRCEKGMRFGNGGRDMTSLCVLVPTYFKEKRRDILMYVLEGSTPCLLGRPALEAFGISINYKAKMVAWDEGQDFEPTTLGPKGEYVVHLAEDSDLIKDKKEADQVFIPDDFEKHVFEEVSLPDVLQLPGDATFSVTEFENEIHPDVTLEAKQQPAASETERDHAQKVTKRESCVRREDDLDKLPPGQLNKIYYDTIASMKELDRNLAKAKTISAASPQDPYVIWEVYAGEGRITKTANRREDCVGIRFSKEDGWDFSNPAHRRAFFRKQNKEKPDAVIYSPVCKLWSPMQELNRTKSVVYAANLEIKRQEDHETHLTFVAVGYEKQRREGRIALVEHPWSARSWHTEAFSRMKGFDTRVDMCEYGLQLPDDDGNINPVQKPTCVRTTSLIIYNQLWRECRADHWHTHLEGYAQGMGLRTALAENYTQQFATKVVNAIIMHLDLQDDIQATDDIVDEANMEQPEEKQLVESDPIRSNKALRAKVGGRAVEYVQRLHKILVIVERMS